MTQLRPDDFPDSILYPVTSLARQLAEDYEQYLPKSLHTELNSYLVDLYSADHDRWADSPDLYSRVAAKIEARILAGEWASEEPLPTRELAREYGVSPNHLRAKVYRKLWDFALVTPRGPQQQQRWCALESGIEEDDALHTELNSYQVLDE